MKNGWLNRILLLACVILAVLCCIATVTKKNENTYSYTETHTDRSEETAEDESDAYDVSSEEDSTLQADVTQEEADLVTVESSSQPAEESEAVQEITQGEPVAVNPEAPVLVLSSNSVVISAGQSFRYWDYIVTLEDDKDEFEYLSSQIVLDGTYDTGVPGTYELQFWVLDRDGNSSGRQTFVLTVQ